MSKSRKIKDLDLDDYDLSSQTRCFLENFTCPIQIADLQNLNRIEWREAHQSFMEASNLFYVPRANCWQQYNGDVISEGSPIPLPEMLGKLDPLVIFKHDEDLKTRKDVMKHVDADYWYKFVKSKEEDGIFYNSVLNTSRGKHSGFPIEFEFMLYDRLIEIFMNITCSNTDARWIFVTHPMMDEFGEFGEFDSDVNYMDGIYYYFPSNSTAKENHIDFTTSVNKFLLNKADSKLLNIWGTETKTRSKARDKIETSPLVN